ncbi:peptidoglycan-binding domain-containing protein [Streptomyces sp. FR-108]|uniref:peptidoglycan-binding domain-containing protein n=1 Tax=Streptomyces sp. FR-108 TaxID=3416665 RepID=UPI003CFA5592
MHDVSDPSGHICPECGAPRESGSSPTCECARRAADELLQTRSAETAAAEDFDPLRIRPYVDLEVRAEGTGAGPAGDPPPPTAPTVGQDPGDRATISIPLQRTSSDDLPSAPSDVPGGTGRRRRFVLVGAGATAVVVAAAGFAGGLFSYESPSRNGAAPDDIRASVPDTAVDEPSPSDSASPSASESASASASADESPTPSGSESPSDSATTPSSRTSATTRAPAADNSASAAPPSAGPTDKAGPAVLRRGDQGPEVTELQLRLKQLALYVGDADGDYDNRTENAVRSYQFTRGLNEEQGVYTEKTRTHLESETTTP